MEKQRKDISPEETLPQPFIVGIPDFRSGVVLNFEMDYIQYKDPYLYVSYCPWLDLAVYAETYQDLIRKTDEVYWGLIERHIMRGTIRDFLMQTGCPCRVLKLPLVDISAAPGGQEIFS